MRYKLFRQHAGFNKIQVVRTVEKIIGELQKTQALMVCGENRQNTKDLITSMFLLLLDGYQLQLYDKGNIWANNDRLLESSYNPLNPKKDLI